jgi:putative peptidoglycan binding protein
MLWLEKHDKGPVVAFAQQALRSWSELFLKESKQTKVDGIYGSKTSKLVQHVQKHYKLTEDGVLGPKTWARLQDYGDGEVVDFVDHGDDLLVRLSSELFKFGSAPITSFHRQDAMSLLISALRKKTASGKKIGLLRIYGHGSSGKQGMSIGIGGEYRYEGGRIDFGRLYAGRPFIVGGRKKGHSYDCRGGVALSLRHTQCKNNTIKFLQQLRPCMSKLGSVELHGCHIAKGIAGRRLVATCALSSGVPFRATIVSNKIMDKSGRLTLRLPKPNYLFYPMALDLNSWLSRMVSGNE